MKKNDIIYLQNKKINSKCGVVIEKNGFFGKFRLGLVTGLHSQTSIYDYGIDLKTEADGLAVSRPSQFVGKMMEPLLSGCYTMTDSAMFARLLAMYETEGLEVEPSAAAGCEGPRMLLETKEGRSYLKKRRLEEKMSRANHIVWTTGGLFVPKEQHESFRRQAAADSSE